MCLPLHSYCQVSHKDPASFNGRVHRLYLLKGKGKDSGRAYGTRNVVAAIITKYNLPHLPKNIWGGDEGLELFYVDSEGRARSGYEKK